MRNVILYIAMSLDGFIADQDGGVGWLEDESPDIQENENYSKFIKTVDTVIMGHTTYRQIISELSKDRWPYEGMETYVLTHRQSEPKLGVHFVNGEITDLLEELKSRKGKDIWICGGADIVNQLILKDEIDTYHITLIPCILGSGIKLFQENNPATSLKLRSTDQYDGLVDLIYESRRKDVQCGDF